MLSEQVVRKALDVLMELPEAPALQILDLAMRDVSGHISFENLDPRTRHLWGDHLDPPSPFAELVRRAFAPRLDPHAWILMSDDAPAQRRTACAGPRCLAGCSGAFRLPLPPLGRLTAHGRTAEPRALTRR
jgi:hypothetical protein